MPHPLPERLSPFPAPFRPGLGHPHRARPRAGVCACGEATPVCSSSRFSCLREAALGEWELSGRQRLRRQQLLRQQDPAGPRVGSASEHMPGDSCLEVLRWVWALVLVLTHSASLPHSLSEPFPLKVLPPCIEGESVQMQGEQRSKKQLPI